MVAPSKLDRQPSLWARSVQSCKKSLGLLPALKAINKAQPNSP